IVLFEPHDYLIALPAELHRQRRNHDQRRALRAALQKDVVAWIPFRKPCLAGRGQWIAPLKHWKGGGVAHNRRPDTEQTVGRGFRGSDIDIGLRTPDQTPRFSGWEVWVAGPERELGAVRQ